MSFRFVQYARVAARSLRSSPVQRNIVVPRKFPPFLRNLHPANAALPGFAAPSRMTYATSTTATSSSFDPQETAAQTSLDEGTLSLQSGDLVAAAASYQKSITIKETAIAHFNLGVVQYQQSNLPAAIASFLKSLALSTPLPSAADGKTEPLSYPPTPAQLVLADTHTNLGAAYILSVPPRPDLALHHLQSALEISPDSGEICYNLGAVLEASGEEEEALVAYARARKLGIERAAVNERNVCCRVARLETVGADSSVTTDWSEIGRKEEKGGRAGCFSRGGESQGRT